MSLTRLKRQDFYTCICAVIDILVNLYISYLVSGSGISAVLFATMYMVSACLLDVFSFETRNSWNLIGRHILASFTVGVVSILFLKDGLECLFLFSLCNCYYIIWVFIAKKWIHHEVCPGATILLYDKLENLEKAKRITKDCNDLMRDVYHFSYDHGNLDKLERFIQAFHIPQVVICLDSNTDIVLEYCKNAGIVAFTDKRTTFRHSKIRSDELYYVRPMTAWKLFFRGATR